MVDFALVGLCEASHGGYLLALCQEGKAACLQHLSVGVRRDGGGQVVQCGLQVIAGVLFGGDAVADDGHFW